MELRKFLITKQWHILGIGSRRTTLQPTERGRTGQRPLMPNGRPHQQVCTQGGAMIIQVFEPQHRPHQRVTQEVALGSAVASELEAFYPEKSEDVR